MDQYDAVAAFSALAHESRLSIYRTLVKCGPSGMSAGDLAKVVRIGATALSFHLKEMVRAGLIGSVREGRFVRYSVEVERMRQLLNFTWTKMRYQNNPQLTQ